MSRGQTTVADWMDATPDAEPDPEPETATMATVADGAVYSRPSGREPDTDPDAPTECAGCGAHVTETYRRVMGDNDGRVEACPRCSSKSANIRGATAGRESYTVFGGLIE